MKYLKYQEENLKCSRQHCNISRSLVLLGLLLTFVLSACNTSQSPARPDLTNQGVDTSIVGEPEQPVNVVYTTEVDEQGEVTTTVKELPSSAFSSDPEKILLKEEVKIPKESAERVHPKLKEKLKKIKKEKLSKDAEITEQVIISFRNDLKIPRFAQLNPNESVDSPKNKKKLAHNKELVEKIKKKRAPKYKMEKEKLKKKYKHKVKELGDFWLINATIVEMPLEAIPDLLADPNVVYVEPVIDGSATPQTRDVAGGRARINSDDFFNTFMQQDSTGFIALLDTGVRESHTQFSDGQGRIQTQYDCTVRYEFSPPHYSYFCFDFDDLSDTSFTDPCNHGTSSAAVMSANSNQGNRYRGVTSRRIDSFQVYPTSSCRLDSRSVGIAFEKAIELGHKIIVAEMQGGGNAASSISTAADNAFDAGAAIIAANGNYGSRGAGSVASPANAHKAMGVGAYDVVTLSTPSYQSLGPASDGRIKPDIQMPTCTRTASSTSNTSTRSCYNGTSGATPYAGGAAALIHSYLRRLAERDWDPAHIYTYLIVSGDNPYPFNNTRGAGQVRLPRPFRYGNAGSVNVETGQNVEINVNLNSTIDWTEIKAAIWWPETADQAHSDIDLYLVDPNGNIRDRSLNVPSVFELAQVETPVGGNWKLRIVGYDVPKGSQRVYYRGSGIF